MVELVTAREEETSALQMDATPKRDRSSRSRYLEDDGVDTFYDVRRNTIADDLTSTCVLRASAPEDRALAVRGAVARLSARGPRRGHSLGGSGSAVRSAVRFAA